MPSNDLRERVEPLEETLAPPAPVPVKRRASRRPGVWLLVALGLLLLLASTIVLPQLRLVGEAFTDDGGFSFANFIEFFTTPRFQEAILNSLVVAVVAGVLACAVAVPAAYVLAQFDLPGRNGFLTLATMATVSPPFLGAYAWVLLLGRGGILTTQLRAWGIELPFDTIIGPGGIVWVTVWATQALVFLLAYDAFRAIDPSLDEASSSVGAGPWRTRLRIVLPMAVPALVTGFYMSSMKIFTDFGTPLIIGGGTPMLPTAVYYEFLSEVSTNPAIASAGSLVMLGVACIALALQQWALRRRTYASVSSRRRPLQPVRGVKKGLMIAYLGVVFGLSFVPHLVVVGTSLLTWKAGILKWIPTFDNYVRLFDENLEVILMSLLLAGIACVLCVIVAVLVAYLTVRRRYSVISPALNVITMVPYIIPGTVLAIGLILAFGSGPLILTGTATILVLAYFIRRIPYVTKSIEAALTQVHPALEEAAMSVGAKPMRAFRQITVPLVRPAIVSGGTVGFLQMVTELSATVMLYSVPFITMTVVIFTNAMQPASPFGVASAMTVVLMLAVYIPLYFVRRKFASVTSV
ncbi:ABC transporter permease [Agromyces soli]|uniref:Iron ABC transporter permease n=1 Tax=Agromyces soli TaxID=659012 RepID=A0ABY4AXZ0_9MICO|nr:iron ABC transporter permease [Agromyces soli]UOE27890.1 iron ABC transporter permease [Agromyces soli]